MATIEEKIASLAPNACRGCAHFMRVNFDSVYNVTNRQGFCILGQLEGDWGLYVSSSISTRCAGFVFSEAHAKIHEAERKLTDDFHEFLHTLHDKRTANYKAIKPLIAASKEFHKGSGEGTWMVAELVIRKEGSAYFQKLHNERYWEVYRMVTLKKVHYMRFLAGVSIQIHDTFCECGNIEMIQEKE
jgi:hypothetical protein